MGNSSSIENFQSKWYTPYKKSSREKLHRSGKVLFENHSRCKKHFKTEARPLNGPPGICKILSTKKSCSKKCTGRLLEMNLLEKAGLVVCQHKKEARNSRENKTLDLLWKTSNVQALVTTDEQATDDATHMNSVADKKSCCRFHAETSHLQKDLMQTYLSNSNRPRPDISLCNTKHSSHSTVSHRRCLEESLEVQKKVKEPIVCKPSSQDIDLLNMEPSVFEKQKDIEIYSDLLCKEPSQKEISLLDPIIPKISILNLSVSRDSAVSDNQKVKKSSHSLSPAPIPSLRASNPRACDEKSKPTESKELTVDIHLDLLGLPPVTEDKESNVIIEEVDVLERTAGQNQSSTTDTSWKDSEPVILNPDVFLPKETCQSLILNGHEFLPSSKHYFSSRKPPRPKSSSSKRLLSVSRQRQERTDSCRSEQCKDLIPVTTPQSLLSSNNSCPEVTFSRDNIESIRINVDSQGKLQLSQKPRSSPLQNPLVIKIKGHDVLDSLSAKKTGMNTVKGDATPPPPPPMPQRSLSAVEISAETDKRNKSAPESKSSEQEEISVKVTHVGTLRKKSIPEDYRPQRCRKTYCQPQISGPKSELRYKRHNGNCQQHTMDQTFTDRNSTKWQPKVCSTTKLEYPNNSPLTNQPCQLSDMHYESDMPSSSKWQSQIDITSKSDLRNARFNETNGTSTAQNRMISDNIRHATRESGTTYPRTEDRSNSNPNCLQDRPNTNPDYLQDQVPNHTHCPRPRSSPFNGVPKDCNAECRNDGLRLRQKTSKVFIPQSGSTCPVKSSYNSFKEQFRCDCQIHRCELQSHYPFYDLCHSFGHFGSDVLCHPLHRWSSRNTCQPNGRFGCERLQHQVHTFDSKSKSENIFLFPNSFESHRCGYIPGRRGTWEYRASDTYFFRDQHLHDHYSTPAFTSPHNNTSNSPRLHQRMCHGDCKCSMFQDLGDCSSHSASSRCSGYVPSYHKALAMFQRKAGELPSHRRRSSEPLRRKVRRTSKRGARKHDLWLTMNGVNGINGHGDLNGSGGELISNNLPKGCWTIGLINSKFRYLTAETFGFKINANGASLKKKQIWTLEPCSNNGTESTIYLRSHLGKYLAVDSFGNVTCESEERDPGSKFQISVADDGTGRWALRNVTRGYFLGACADKLTCTAKVPGDAELWHVHLAARPQVNLRSVGRKRFAHLSENLDEIHVDANIPWGEDTLFTLEFRVDESGKYALHTCNNKYLSREGKLVDTCNPNCLFSAEYHSGQLALRDRTGAYLSPIGSKAVLKSRSQSVTKDELFSLEDSLPQASFVAALNGRYVSVKQGVDVTANQDEISDHETFQLEFDSSTKRWYIRTMQDRYWTLETGGGIQACGDKRSSNALFDLVWQGDGSVGFRANNGKFISTKRSGHLYANCDTVEDNAKYFFYLINRPILVLKCEQGFVGYKSASSPKLECNKATYETIQVERSEKGVVFFKGQNGKYWHVDGESVTADSDTPEGFFLELRDPTRICIKSVSGEYLVASKNGSFRLGDTDYENATKWEY